MQNEEQYNSGIYTEGIFRLPGDTRAVEMLREQFTRAKFDVKCDDPHVCASLFKLWFRNLADPIMPDHMYSRLLKASGHIDGCLSLVAEIPVVNRHLLSYLISFLAQMSSSKYASKTKV